LLRDSGFHGLFDRCFSFDVSSLAAHLYLHRTRFSGAYRLFYFRGAGAVECNAAQLPTALSVRAAQRSEKTMFVILSDHILGRILGNARSVQLL
jgi:hypothetical protein